MAKDKTKSELLTEAASLIQTHMDNGEAKVMKIDPATSMILSALLEALLPLLLSRCEKSAEDLHKMALSPSRRERIALRLFARRELGAADFREIGGRNVCDSMIVVAASDQGGKLMGKLSS